MQICRMRQDGGFIENWTAVKEKPVSAARHADKDGFVSAFGREIEFQPFAKLRGVDANDIVLSSVVFRRPAKNLFTDFLLIDFRLIFISSA